MPDEIVVPIHREEDIVRARSEGRDRARQLGFGLVDQSRIPTAISELARNILRYAGAGEIRIRTLSQAGRTGIEVTATDMGPGIQDVTRAMQDGFSTSGGLGMGLPGAKRLMGEMEIETAVGKGTTVTVRKWLAR